ncbi:MAG: site-specific DNA-methyltransferase, partial [Nanoarchaeota archaeon]
KLCDIFDEVKRVLKKEGTCWVNMGDVYNSGGNYRKDGSSGRGYKYNRTEFGRVKMDKRLQRLEDKALCQIPSRFAIEMSNRGWILRNEIIWHKPNCMPSSVEDRFSVDFEKLYFFVKNKKYYFEQQFEKSIWADKDKRAINGPSSGGKATSGNYSINKGGAFRKDGLRNKRSVWTINTKPFAEAHFATYPEKLCLTPIKAGCPEGGVVLDPFMGSGTTALVAKKLSRKYLGIELNPEYIKIAEQRLAQGVFNL